MELKELAKKTLKNIFKTIVGFLVFVVLYIVFAFGFSSITVKEEANSEKEIAIYIKTNGVHTDIVVPTKSPEMDWSKEVKFSNTESKDTSSSYLALGWGDKGFYLETPNWSDLKASVAFKAAFALSSSAIHATYYNKMIENESCKKILISKNQYQRLIKFISKSFKKDTNDHLMYIITNANYGKNDAFYEANGSYSLFYTCNTWANSALKACGQRCCFWTPYDKGIFKKYNK